MRIAIIGGGAAGMMAAATLAENSQHPHEIFLIEKNSILGKKVLVSGGGRCNVTTGIQDIKTVLGRYPRGGRFLSYAMHQFSPKQVYDWFEAHGTKLKTEDDLRVFPVSNNGADIVNVFERIFQKHSCHVLLNESVEDINKDTQTKLFSLTLKSGKKLEMDAVVLTTGGQAYRHTGSTGDGYAFAEKLGHTLAPLAPGLNAFITQEKWTAEISGVSWEDAELSVPGNKAYRYRAPFLFTHKGITGPAVFALSSLIAYENYTPQTPLLIHIDLFPDTKQSDLETKLFSQTQENPQKSFRNTLAFLLPKSLASIVCENLSLPEEKKNIEMPKKDIFRVGEYLKHLPLHISGRMAGDEFITAGGVNLKEVDSKTMESRICPNLYFAGEILDIDGFTGGFNLQASWATGRAVGKALEEK